MLQNCCHVFETDLKNDSMLIWMSTCNACSAFNEVVSHGCSGPDECVAELNGPERIATHVNAVLLVAKK